MVEYLFYDSSSSGHHGEFFENIIYSLNDYHAPKSLILASPSLKTRLDSFKDKIGSKISLIYLNSDEIYSILNTKGRVKKGFKEVEIIERYLTTHKVKHLILLNLGIQMIPLGFYKSLPNISIRGIYLQNISFANRGINLKEKRKILVRRFRQFVNLKLMLSNQKVSKVYILNDKKAAKYLNAVFRTNKFEMLYDPLPATSLGIKLKNEDSEYFEFSFVGMIQKRKGIIEFLNALLRIKDNLPKKIRVNFLGLNSDDPEYRRLVLELTQSLESEMIKFRFHNTFIEYEALNNALYNSDCIVAVYKNHFYSSGMLAHSCKFKKPLLVSKSGLLGEYVRENKLGLSVDPNNSQDYSKAILSMINNHYNYNSGFSENYHFESSPEKFTNKLISV